MHGQLLADPRLAQISDRYLAHPAAIEMRTVLRVHTERELGQLCTAQLGEKIAEHIGIHGIIHMPVFISVGIAHGTQPDDRSIRSRRGKTERCADLYRFVGTEPATLHRAA